MQGQDFWIFFWCGFASKHAIWTYTCPQFIFVRIRLKIFNFFVVGIRLKTIIPMLHRCVFGPNPFSTYHSKICSDHVLFIPTWIPKRVQDLDLRNEADCELLSYGAYVYALGCYLMVNWANALQDDGSRIVSRLKQTCSTTGVARKWVMTVTDVMILNYTVRLDVTRDGTQCNTQGVWPCKLQIDSLPLQILAMSPDLMEDLRKQPRRCFP